MRQPVVHYNVETSLHSLLSEENRFDEDALTAVWKYCVQEGHLPTFGKELIKFFGVLFVSGGSWLYGALAARATEGYPKWEAYSHIFFASVCGAVVLIRATHEFLLNRDSRRMPNPLRKFGFSDSKWREFLEDSSVLLVSAISSISLATTAWRYPEFPNELLQILWFIYIEIVNTLLHLLSVDLVIFNHPIYSLPLKPFRWLYGKIERCILSNEQMINREFAQFKRGIADQLCQNLCASLDRAVEHIINQSFEKNGFSKGFLKWLSYVKKENSLLEQINSNESGGDLADVLNQQPQLPQEEKSGWCHWLWKKAQQVSYVAGASLVSLSCLGYMADPPALLQSYGWSKEESYVLSAPALYFFGVLLGHLGGVTAETDFISITQTVLGKGAMPLAAKLHTKTFWIALIINLYTAAFSYKAAEKIAADHFGESGWMAQSIKWCADFGIAYLSWGSMKAFYDYYLTQSVRLNPKDDNYFIAEYQERIADFKRRIRSIDADQLVVSLEKLPQKELALGMSETEFESKTDFNKRFEETLQNRNKNWLEYWKNRGSIYSKINNSTSAEVFHPVFSVNS